MRLVREHGVTGVAARVVDPLEVVDVEEGAGERAIEADGCGDGLLQPGVELPPVRQAGEAVEQRGAFQLVALGLGAERGAHAGEQLVRVERLCHVVDRAGLETADAGGDVAAWAVRKMTGGGVVSSSARASHTA